MRRGLLLATVGLVISACGYEFHPPDSDERIRQADELYTPEMFDSLSWENDSVRSFEGNAVYAATCRRCHGTMGDGDTEYARGRDLQVPSLVEPDWPLASSLDSLRHEIFAGHEGGMPGFGVAGITAREIDASAFFILNTLRPDVLAPDASGPDGTKVPPNRQDSPHTLFRACPTASRTRPPHH